MHHKKGPQFLTEPSDSSLLYDQAYRKRLDSPRGVDKQDKTSTIPPKFVETNPICPDKTMKIVVFNSSGEKRDPCNVFNILDEHCKVTDCESARTATSKQKLAATQEYLGSLPTASQSVTNCSRSRDISENFEENSALKEVPVRFLPKRSRTRVIMTRKKRSPLDIKNHLQRKNTSRNKETSTESVLQSNVSTQTDIKYAFCRKCLQKDPTKHAVDSRSSGHKIDAKPLKTHPPPGAANKASPIRATNAFCTAVNVTPLPLNQYPASNITYEPSRTASSAGLAKSKRTPVKRPLTEKNEAIHQEILNLKKTVDKSGLHTKQLTLLNGALPLNGLGKPSYLYCKIKNANKNGSLRYTLSMLVFAILLFWLISAIFHFDFFLEILRRIGRQLSSLPIFIARRKKELSTAEIMVKYVASFGRTLKGILTGAP